MKKSTTANALKENLKGVNIYDEIKKEIQRVIDSENPNDKGQDNLEEYYNSESEGRDIKGEV